MGLDITAYNQARLLPEDEAPEEDGWDDNAVYAHIDSPSFFLSARGLELNRWYDISDSKALDFRAGSYRGYSHFRSELAAIGGAHTGAPDRPFYELVYFSDCEGTIGPEAAADLAADFAAHREQAKEVLGVNFDLYETWREACVLASDNGLIDFH